MGTTPLIKVCKPSALIFSLSAAVARPRRKRGVVVDCTIAVVLNHGVLHSEVVDLVPSAKMEGEGLRVGGPAEWTRRTFRCPASPTHKKETCRGVVKRHPLFLGEVVKRNPVTHSQQKSRSMNGRRLCATLFGPPSPRRSLRPTQEAYPKHRRAVKSKAPRTFERGA